MPRQHDNATKEARSRAAIAVAEEMKAAWENAQIGTVQEVLFEETQGEFAVGHAPNYAKIYVRVNKSMHNQLHKVKILGKHADGLLGQIL